MANNPAPKSVVPRTVQPLIRPRVIVGKIPTHQNPAPVTVSASGVGSPAPVVTEEAPQVSQQTLRTDGPTLREYTAAGYDPEGYPPEGYAARQEPSVVYRFAKIYGVAEQLTFPDGTTFKFRLIPRVTGGFSPTSSVETEDEKLAANLREAAKTNQSIREAPPIKN